MTNIVNSSGINSDAFSFLPPSFLTSAKNRMDVCSADVTKEKLSETIKKITYIEQEVLLHDLLVAGQKMTTERERNWIVLAAELFLYINENTQKDFLMHLMGSNELTEKFTEAMLVNSVIHLCQERAEQGSSGLSIQQLKRESSLAHTFDEQRNKNSKNGKEEFTEKKIDSSQPKPKERAPVNIINIQRIDTPESR
ncbi:MAG: hypothetical protein JWO53_1316 [Chlamydiia bacterium]|nr:hypothetical protein [Chlamydiia bacterium]